MDYGSSDTSTTSLGANQFPISETWTPNAGFSALEGGPQSTDSGGKKSAPASMYVKDGGDVAQGQTTDAANANTVVGQLKQIQTNTNGSATAANQTTANTSLSSVATNTSNTATNTSNVNTAIGTRTDTKATDGSVTAWSVIALLKGIIDKLLSTLAVTQSGTWTVQPGNTANTTAWKVDGSGVTQPVSGSVTANAGTNLNTSLLALETGGNLASAKTDLDNISTVSGATTDVAVVGDNTGTVSAKLRGLTKILNDIWDSVNHRIKVDGSGVTQPVSGTFWQATQPVSGTVTANAGTGNMGSNLTQVAGNNVAVGNNAVPVLNSAATGYVAAFGSNAAALTSATDYSFKWGAGGTTQVNHILLQNNTASSLNWDLDVAATGGSPTLASGQTLFLDVQTSTLHLFQAGTSSVNGSSSGNIVVRAWV